MGTLDLRAIKWSVQLTASLRYIFIQCFAKSCLSFFCYICLYKKALLGEIYGKRLLVVGHFVNSTNTVNRDGTTKCDPNDRENRPKRKLGRVDLIIKVACFVKSVNNFSI
jgi:hypothetical protein